MPFGKEAGDLTKIPVEKLDQGIDLLCAGPQRPPWAGNGLKRGSQDTRAHVFIAAIRWAVHWIKTG